jgi:hypothetical protein
VFENGRESELEPAQHKPGPNVIGTCPSEGPTKPMVTKISEFGSKVIAKLSKQLSPKEPKFTLNGHQEYVLSGATSEATCNLVQ